MRPPYHSELGACWVPTHLDGIARLPPHLMHISFGTHCRLVTASSSPRPLASAFTPTMRSVVNATLVGGCPLPARKALTILDQWVMHPALLRMLASLFLAMLCDAQGFYFCV
ncbi:hypothetical protein CVT26_016089 [Gymnopilus dilepis]|uniref:Uncharacterized protein n=1 Tax=Gymnopilus dilepis TaxID=231916 RepID=A0A409YDY4_9AGAR|nr:hypothetical protein CVT26_016089 [Gymnopilus dilepis]